MTTPPLSDLKAASAQHDSLARQAAVAREARKELALKLLNEPVPEAELADYILKVKEASGVSVQDLRNWCTGVAMSTEGHYQPADLVPVAVIEVLDRLANEAKERAIERRTEAKRRAHQRGEL